MTGPLITLRPLWLVCGKPAGPFGAMFAEFCACDQRDGSTFAMEP